MPIVPGLDFVKDNLSVAYRASAEPQSLEIRASLDGWASNASGPLSMLGFEEAMRAGAASGAEFPPTAGHARHVSGPLRPRDEGARGPDFRWELEVTAISPYFIRNLVTELGTIGVRTKTKSVAISGSLPLDDSVLSVRESQVKGWLEDSTTFMREWHDPGFPLTRTDANRSAATVRLWFQRDLDAKLLDDVVTTLQMWRNLVIFHPNPSLSGLGTGTIGPRSARKRREFVTTYDPFNYLRPPTEALLVNMLSYFNAKVEPLDAAEISLPSG